jgi:hypothetical protein
MEAFERAGVRHPSNPSQGRNFLKLIGDRKDSALVPDSYHGQDFTSDLREAVSKRVRESDLKKPEWARNALINAAESPT